MDFNAWDVDLESATAVHISGFKITVEGDVKDPMGVHPGKFPEALEALEQARLLRSGLEAIVSQAQKSDEQKSHNTQRRGFFHWFRLALGKK